MTTPIMKISGSNPIRVAAAWYPVKFQEVVFNPCTVLTNVGVRLMMKIKAISSSMISTILLLTLAVAIFFHRLVQKRFGRYLNTIDTFMSNNHYVFVLHSVPITK